MNPGRSKGLAIVAALLSALLAGCMDDGAEREPQGEEDPPRLPSAVGKDEVLFQSCERAFLTTEVPEEWTLPYLPEGFRAQGDTPFTTALHLEGLACDSITFDRNVTRDVRSLTVTIRVAEVATDGERTIGALALEVFASEPLFVAFLSQHGHAARHAEITISDVDGVSGDRRSWSITAGATSLGFDHAVNSEFEPPRGRDTIFWATNGEPHHIDETATIATASPPNRDVVTIAMEGPSVLSEVLDGPDTWAFLFISGLVDKSKHTYSKVTK